MNVTYSFIVFWIMFWLIYAVSCENLEDMICSEKGTHNCMEPEDLISSIQTNADFMIPFLEPLKCMIGIGGKSLKVTEPTTDGKRNAVEKGDEAAASAQRKKSQPVTMWRRESRNKSTSFRAGKDLQKITTSQPTKMMMTTIKSYAKKSKGSAQVEDIGKYTTKFADSADKENVYENHNQIASDSEHREREYPLGKFIATIIDNRNFVNNVPLSVSFKKGNTTKRSENYNNRSESNFSNISQIPHIFNLKKYSKTESNGSNFVKSNDRAKRIDILQNSSGRTIYTIYPIEKEMFNELENPNNYSFVEERYKQNIPHDFSKNIIFQGEEKNESLKKCILPMNNSDKYFPLCYIISQKDFPNIPKSKDVRRYTPSNTYCEGKHILISELNYKSETPKISPTKAMFQVWRIDLHECTEENRLCLTENAPSRKWENIGPSERMPSPEKVSLDKQQGRKVPCEGLREGSNGNRKHSEDFGRSKGSLGRSEEIKEMQDGNQMSSRWPDGRNGSDILQADDSGRTNRKMDESAHTESPGHLGAKIDQLYKELQRTLSTRLYFIHNSTVQTRPDEDEDEKILRASDALPQVTTTSSDKKNTTFFPQRIPQKIKTSKWRNISYTTPYQFSAVQNSLIVYPPGGISKEKKFLIDFKYPINERNKCYSSSDLKKTWSFQIPIFENHENIYLLRKIKVSSPYCSNIIPLFPSGKRLIGKDNKEDPTNEYLAERNGLIDENALTAGIEDFTINSRYLFSIEPYQSKQTDITKSMKIRPWLRKSDEHYWKKKFRNGSSFANHFEESLKINMKNNFYTSKTTFMPLEGNWQGKIPFATTSYLDLQDNLPINYNLRPTKESIIEWTETYEEPKGTESYYEEYDKANRKERVNDINEDEYEAPKNADYNISDDPKTYTTYPEKLISDMHAYQSGDNYIPPEHSLSCMSKKPYTKYCPNKLESIHNRNLHQDNLKSWKNLTLKVAFSSSGKKLTADSALGSVDHLHMDRRKGNGHEREFASSTDSSDQLVNNHLLGDSWPSTTESADPLNDVATDTEYGEGRLGEWNWREYESVSSLSPSERERWDAVQGDSKATDLKFCTDLQQLQDYLQRTFLGPAVHNYSGIDGEITSLQVALFKYVHKPQENESPKDNLDRSNIILKDRNKNYKKDFKYISSQKNNNDPRFIIRKTKRKYDADSIMNEVIDHGSQKVLENKEDNRTFYPPHSNISLHTLEINSGNKKKNIYSTNLNKLKLKAAELKYPLSHVKSLDKKNFSFGMSSKHADEQLIRGSELLKKNVEKIINSKRKGTNTREPELIINKYNPFTSLNKNKFVKYLIST